MVLTTFLEKNQKQITEEKKTTLEEKDEY